MASRLKPSAASQMSGNTPRLKPAPRATKKMIRKKSRSGLRLSAMNSAIGLRASDTPAINAPIS